VPMIDGELAGHDCRAAAVAISSSHFDAEPG
jgi:hypothetical protein